MKVFYEAIVLGKGLLLLIKQDKDKKDSFTGVLLVSFTAIDAVPAGNVAGQVNPLSISANKVIDLMIQRNDCPKGCYPCVHICCAEEGGVC